MPTYYALDCLPFKDQNINDSRLLNRLKELCELEINTIFGSIKELKENPLLYIDNKNGLWTAGRFVGNTSFNEGNSNYKLIIEPRFGKDVLKWLICEITNIRFSPARGKSKKDNNNDTLLILLTYLWLMYLSEANRYGLPRNKIRDTYFGNKVRGRLDIRKSIISYKTQKKLVSSYNKKVYDDKVIQLLKFTLEHLKKSNSGFTELNKSDSTKDAISHLNKVTLSRRRFTHHDFSNIKLGSIYQSYGRIIDLSWNILQNTASNEIIDESNEKTLGTFLDMAEIWEKFLRKVLADKLTGWKDITPKEVSVYHEGSILNRKMIPDIVFERGNTVLVIDAKYKRMVGKKMDIDREDFYQIHTYIHYYEQKYKKVIGGLVYPITGELLHDKISEPQKLFGENKKHKYFVDGMQLDFNDDKPEELEAKLNDEKNQLVERIKQKIED